jgi:hypothetical protein
MLKLKLKTLMPLKNSQKRGNIVKHILMFGNRDLGCSKQKTCLGCPNTLEFHILNAGLSLAAQRGN